MLSRMLSLVIFEPKHTCVYEKWLLSFVDDDNNGVSVAYIRKANAQSKPMQHIQPHFHEIYSQLQNLSKNSNIYSLCD